VVCTAQFDPLRDAGEAYAAALLAAGVATYRRHGEGLVHGYFEMTDFSAAAKAEAARAVRFQIC
jgi:acetyl esterase